MGEGTGIIRFRDKEGKEKEIIFHGKNAEDVELREDISVYFGKLRGRDSLTTPEFFERNFKRIRGYVLMDTNQLPQNLDPKIVGFERIEELEDPSYGHAGLYVYKKVGEVRNLAVIMGVDQYISEMEIEKKEIYGIKDITGFYKNQFRKIKKKVDELPQDQRIIITNTLGGMGFSKKAKNAEELKEAFEEGFKGLTLTEDDMNESSEEKAKNFIDNLCKKYPNLKDMYADLKTKLGQYTASNKAYTDLLKETGEVPEFPAYLVLTPEVLKEEILRIVSEVTGIKYEELLTDYLDKGKIKVPYPLRIVDYTYGLTEHPELVNVSEGYISLVNSEWIIGEIVRQLDEPTGFFRLKKIQEKHSEAMYRLASINGLRLLAHKREDITL
ncbi:MAG: hypothetical protein KAU03_04485, partial [Candidatus Altiarchaeales archaeon]|nr:hypothetical protein [Candidatus Altiarchaeales archaeon]